jgi:hypothetical protein
MILKMGGKILSKFIWPRIMIILLWTGQETFGAYKRLLISSPAERLVLVASQEGLCSIQSTRLYKISNAFFFLFWCTLTARVCMCLCRPTVPPGMAFWLSPEAPLTDYNELFRRFPQSKYKMLYCFWLVFRRCLVRISARTLDIWQFYS